MGRGDELPSSLRRISLILLLLAPSAHAACGDSAIRFDIPALPLERALIAFGRQSGCSIVFDPALLAAMTTTGVRAAATPRSALKTLLADHALRFSFAANGLVTVVAAPVSDASVAERPIKRGATEPSAHDQPPLVETVWVTGTPITGSRFGAIDSDDMIAVDIISSEAISRSGHQTIGDVLRAHPAVAGNLTSTLVTNGGDGTATVTLRGLPAANTLVLVNGQRTSPDAFKAQSVDLNTLPLAMVERIEVLKDGVSAIYGSDAIAGVVNIITRRHVKGADVSLYSGMTQRGDLSTQHINAAWGNSTPRLSYAVGGTWYRQGPIYSRDRSISRTADDRPRGGVDRRSSAAPSPRVLVSDRALTLVDPGLDGTDVAHYRTVSDNDGYDFRQATTAVVPSQRASLLGTSTLRVSSTTNAWMDGLLSYSSSENVFAPTPIFTAFDLSDLAISADNPFNPFGVPVVDLRRRAVEFGARRQRNVSRASRAGFGVRHTAPTWDVEWYSSYQLSQGYERFNGLIDASRLRLGVGSPAYCDDECEPVNLFGGPGSITPSMVRYLHTSIRDHADAELAHSGVTATWDGPALPAGNIQTATGIEYRFESLRTRPDPLSLAGDTVGVSTVGPTDADRNIWEAFAELLVPVWRSGTDRRVDLSLAARHSHYGDFGSTTNPRAALRFKFNPEVQLRASAAQGFRAPTLPQLHISQQSSFEFLSDPCTAAGNVGVLPGCISRADPSLNQFLTITGGNRELLPERATNHTWGVSYAPQWLPGVDLHADRFVISQRDVVDANAQYIVNENAFSGRFPERVLRDPNGNIRAVLATQLNIGRRKVKGWDLSGRARVPIAASELALTINATRISAFVDRLNPSAASVDHAGTFSDEASAGNGSLPDWKANISMSWSSRSVEMTYNALYVSPLRETVPGTATNRTIDQWWRQDVQVAYSGTYAFGAEVRVGILNVFDEQPPFAASAFNDSFDGRTYDLAGRYWYLQLERAFQARQR